MTRWNRWCLYLLWLATIALLRMQSLGESETWGYTAWVIIGGAAILSIKHTKTKENTNV